MLIEKTKQMDNKIINKYVVSALSGTLGGELRYCLVRDIWGFVEMYAPSDVFVILQGAGMVQSRGP